MFGEKSFKGQPGYSTPVDVPVGSTKLVINVPDNASWWGVYLGLLLSLTEESAWRQLDGGISVADAADAAMSIFQDAVDCATTVGGCMDCCPELPEYMPVSGDLQVTDGIAQLSLDGGTTWLDLPTTDAPAIIPHRVLMPGSDEAAKICNAAARATATLAETYRQTFGVIAADLANTLTDINEFFFGINSSLFGIAFPRERAILDSWDFFGDYPYDEHWSASVLDSDAKDLLLCLLIEQASLAGGIVSFDYGAVKDNLIARLGVNPGTAMTLIVARIGQEGLNRAGDIGVIDDADCSVCEEEPNCEMTEHFDTGFNAKIIAIGDLPFSPGLPDYFPQWSSTGGYGDNGGCMKNVAGSHLTFAIDLGEDCNVRGITFQIKSNSGGYFWKIFKHYNEAGSLLRTVNQGDGGASSYSYREELPSAAVKRYIVVDIEAWPGGGGDLFIDDLVVVA